MIKQYTYKFRLYPTKEQEAFLLEQIGYNRFVYNFFLERVVNLYKVQSGEYQFGLYYCLCYFFIWRKINQGIFTNSLYQIAVLRIYNFSLFY